MRLSHLIATISPKTGQGMGSAFRRVLGRLSARPKMATFRPLRVNHHGNISMATVAMALRAAGVDVAVREDGRGRWLVAVNGKEGK